MGKHTISRAFRVQAISVCLCMIDALDYPPASAPLLRVAIGRNVKKVTAKLIVNHMSSLTQSMSATFVIVTMCGISADKLFPDFSTALRPLLSKTLVQPRHARLLRAKDNQLKEQRYTNHKEY